MVRFLCFVLVSLLLCKSLVAQTTTSETTTTGTTTESTTTGSTTEESTTGTTTESSTTGTTTESSTTGSTTEESTTGTTTESSTTGSTTEESTTGTTTESSTTGSTTEESTTGSTTESSTTGSTTEESTTGTTTESSTTGSTTESSTTGSTTEYSTTGSTTESSTTGPSPPFASYIWQEIIPTNLSSAPRRYGASIGYDSNDIIFVLGGNTDNGSIAYDNYKYEISKRVWTKLPLHFNRTGACSAQALTTSTDDSISENLLIFGGKIDSAVSQELLSFHTKDASLISLGYAKSETPSEGVACSTKDGKDLIVFGGNCKSETWVYSSDKKEWTKQEPKNSGPHGRDGASAVAMGDKLIIFGGHCNRIMYNDVWEYDFVTAMWTEITLPESALAPAKRWHHSAFLDSVNNYMYIFGGSNFNNTMGDLWQFSLTDKKWNEIASSLSGRENSQVTYDGKTRVLVQGGNPSPSSLTAGNSAASVNPYSDVWQLIIEGNCLGKQCMGCTSNNLGCGWCDSNQDGYKCVAGITSPYLNFTCASTTFYTLSRQCPEEGFPSWAIALCVIGGVVLIGIVVFAVMKSRNDTSYAPIR